MRVGADPEAIRLTSDALAQHLVPVPKDLEAVCPNCHTWLPSTSKGMPSPVECENCREVRAVLGRAPLVLIVASLYCKPSPLRDILTRYKGRDDDDDPFDPAQVVLVRAMLGRLLLEHGSTLVESFGQPEALVIVPSTDRIPPHPLEEAIGSLDMDVPTMPLLVRGPGNMGFRRPHPAGFQARPADKPQRIWLIDDVYTTGSRINSAATALEAAGHLVLVAMVLARRINPQYSDEAARFWDHACRHAFDWQEGPWL